VRRWKAILGKLEPPAPKREPLPPLKPPGEPSMVVARMRGTSLSGGGKAEPGTTWFHLNLIPATATPFRSGKTNGAAKTFD
jgi:hypothetical protein